MYGDYWGLGLGEHGGPQRKPQIVNPLSVKIMMVPVQLLHLKK